jgi:hypothetical protein
MGNSLSDKQIFYQADSSITSGITAVEALLLNTKALKELGFLSQVDLWKYALQVVLPAFFQGMSEGK